MKKQKICIIGGSLTGLVTAICLSKLNCEIDLIMGTLKKNLQSSRTIAVSENNLDFLNKLNISKSIKNDVWTCSRMKLYSEFEKGKLSEVFDLNQENKKENIFYMLENSKIINLMINKIKNTQSIKLLKNKKVTSVFNSGLLKNVKFNNSISKYNLVIICSGNNSILVQNNFESKIIKNSYQEFAATTVLSHSPLKNNIARQIFLDNSIFAMLPISKDKTSIVWSVKNLMKKKSDIYLRKKIKFYALNYLKNVKFISRIEKKDLNFLIRDKYYQERTLLFGDALHLLHPFVGQSFNMTLRDLKSLEKILEKKINLGLDIGNTDVLSEFSKNTKSRNFSFSIASDVLKNALSYKVPRNDVLKILNKSNYVKSFAFDIANKGFRF